MKIPITINVALCIICMLVIVILSVRLFQYKQQIRRFTQITSIRKDMDQNPMVTVECFDKDVIALANVLNEYTKQQKELAKQYEQNKKHLQYVIAGISHDFRTPLTAAKGYLQLIEKNPDNPQKVEEYLHIVKEKIIYLKQLSDEFFEVSSLEADSNPVQFEKIHLNKVMSECILGQYEWIEKRELVTEFTLLQHDIFVMGNVNYMNRIMENLFSNAKKYAKTKLAVHVEVKRLDKTKMVVITMVNDICDDEMTDMERIFEPFYRSHARNEQGTGLGLYVTKCLCEKMGYNVKAHCAECLFTISIEIPVNGNM